MEGYVVIGIKFLNGYFSKNNTMKYILYLCCFFFVSISFGQKAGQAEFDRARAAFDAKDFQKWFDESMKGAALGHPDALFYIAMGYDNYYAQNFPIPTPKNDAKALEYYKKAGAAGQSEGAYIAGELLRLGEVVPKNEVEALTWYKRAFELGHPDAPSVVYNMLGGANPYIAYLKDCVNRGNYDVASELGTIYIKGEIVSANIGEAMKWLEVGEKNNNAGCMYIIGYLYRNGFKRAQDGVVTLNNKDANIPKAVEYYTRAGGLGNVESMNNLGEMYMQGMEIKQDYTQSFNWFDKSCQSNDGYGCYMCSVLINNRNVSRSMDEAGRYSRKALELGYKPGN
jgi:TPR repeat protein